MNKIKLTIDDNDNQRAMIAFCDYDASKKYDRAKYATIDAHAFCNEIACAIVCDLFDDNLNVVHKIRVTTRDNEYMNDNLTRVELIDIDDDNNEHLLIAFNCVVVRVKRRARRVQS